MSPKKKNGKKLWIIIGVVVIIAGLVAANLLTKRGPKGVDVDVTVAQLDSLTQTVTASGKIQPKEEVKISANVSGRILYLGAEEGDMVQKDQLLVRIEDENYAAQLEQMRFSLASGVASLDEAKSRLKRTRELHENGLSSDADLETAMASVKRLEADVDRMRANVTQGEDQLSKTRIYSPISGTVTQLNKEVGEMAIGATFSQDIIMVVSKLDQMEVDVEVNENDVVLIAIGDPVKIEVFALPDTSFNGMVTEIAHSGVIRNRGSSEEVTNFSVTVAVTDQVVELRPGMSATVEVVTETRSNTLVLPQEAVAVRTMSDENRRAEQARNSDKDDNEGEMKSGNMGTDKEEPVEVVFIAQGDTVWAKQVKLGIYSDTHFEILEGIHEGDVIVTGPFRLLSRELHSGTIVSYSKPDMPGEEADSTMAEGESSDGES
ncbi:efflux RND transporter periplasmic adaptor subunit [bacterium]|nr:efflux RND transporter periplasmic adaptor subunit [bacterium]